MNSDKLVLNREEVACLLRSLQGEDVFDDDSCFGYTFLFDLLHKLLVYRDYLKSNDTEVKH